MKTIKFLATAIAALAVLTRIAQADDVVRVGEGPFISAGAFFIAKDKGYFKKLGIDVETKTFADGAMAIPSIISGELDITNMPAAAGLFNAIAKGAPLVMFLDRGNNSPGKAYTTASVTQEVYDQGVHSLADFAKLKGMKVGVTAQGSINHYNMALALQKAGLDPVHDVQWVFGVAQPDLMKMLGQKQVDVADLAYQFAFFARSNHWSQIVASGDQIEPAEQIATFAVRKDFLDKKRDVLVRWTTAYLQGVKEFNAAAAQPDQHPDVIDILAKNTALQKPELVKAIAPNWSYINPDGIPNVASIMRMQDYWNSPAFHLVEKKIPQEQLFDLSVTKEAAQRLARDKPFD
ncbi:MAG: ABC transporter substrate-binding protein [Xanthobacteraceae bacterium]